MISKDIVKSANEYYFGNETRKELETKLDGWQEEIIHRIHIKRKLIEAKNGKEISALVKEFDEELKSYVENKVQISLLAMAIDIKYGGI